MDPGVPQNGSQGDIDEAFASLGPLFPFGGAVAPGPTSEVAFALEIEEGGQLWIGSNPDISASAAVASIRERMPGPEISIKGMTPLAPSTGLDRDGGLVGKSSPDTRWRGGF